MSGPYYQDPYYQDEMDSAPAGSVRRARERARAGVPRQAPPPTYHYDDDAMMDDDMPPGDLRAPPRRFMAPPPAPPPAAASLPRHPKPRGPAGGLPISRPTQVPQWPLPGPPLASVNQNDSEPYRPPPGRPQQAPRRPPRPSQVPSLLDQSKLQDPTPVFLARDDPDSLPASPSSRATDSTMETIPDFPAPYYESEHDARRSAAHLGPPPSSRRGASSFYSHPSFVSPIPEESVASRSHRSYASSAAMPDSWPAASREGSPTFYYKSDEEEENSTFSAEYEFHDESKLVRSASLGKRAKPALVHTKSSAGHDSARRPSPSPMQKPFDNGTGYVDVSSSSSNALPRSNITRNVHQEELSPNEILDAYASTSEEGDSQSVPPVAPQQSKKSAIRRPPRLDIDAVRAAEERGSMTSLPDLIRRATRLASMIDRGKRPASRLDELDGFFFDDKGRARGGEKENSGLSDMLNAFPPPAQPDRTSRGSWFRHTSWPLQPRSRDGQQPSRLGFQDGTSDEKSGGKPRKRRCCGLPIWAFVIIMILLVCLVAAAVIIPLEFFVFKNLPIKARDQSSMNSCADTLVCQNGGTNVLNAGVCSCICTSGFTGADCSTRGSDGCTTTDLISESQDKIHDATLGTAIPQLISEANKNYSIPLSGTSLMAKINKGALSCLAQNALVTFDGSSTASQDEKRSTNKRLENTDRFDVTDDVLEFARVAVLYVLQQENVSNAEDAQTNIQNFLTEAGGKQGVAIAAAKKIELGHNSAVDLVNFTVNLGSGTIGGSKGKRDLIGLVTSPHSRIARHGNPIV